MPKEWIDVVDTAVKIGLGALISGGFTFLGLKYKSSSENKRFMLENKAKILEEVASEIHDYLIAWRYYTSIVSGITRRKMMNDEDGSDFTKGQLQSIAERNSTLVEAWPKRESAVSKLTLLKGNKVAETIMQCNELESELRNLIVFDKKTPLYKDVQDYSKRVKEHVALVNADLANFYATLES